VLGHIRCWVILGVRSLGVRSLGVRSLGVRYVYPFRYPKIVQKKFKVLFSRKFLKSLFFICENLKFSYGQGGGGGVYTRLGARPVKIIYFVNSNKF